MASAASMRAISSLIDASIRSRSLSCDWMLAFCAASSSTTAAWRFCALASSASRFFISFRARSISVTIRRSCFDTRFTASARSRKSVRLVAPSRISSVEDSPVVYRASSRLWSVFSALRKLAFAIWRWRLFAAWSAWIWFSSMVAAL